MSISARNQLNVEITEVKSGAVNSLIVAKMPGGETLKATVTIDSEKALELKAGKKAVFLFKASSVIVAKNGELKLSATNQIKGVVSEVKDGAVNSEIIIDAKGDKISAIITKHSSEHMHLKVGDSVTAIIKATQIIVGVK
ncbi:MULTISPECIES: TOBE domain-containing protein [Campylobacter]|uniref:Molybdenum-pterin binding domain-containing protein n=1 Tax=Campylobacter curvus (strain 525.92) TaxID=360105 RepID=A7GW15_CAMC5|nr:MULTISPECIES: TOBE domain-containing protein [Campylobacter]EAT99665.1 molybdenum-pterin binding domain-containing protein [Campylobacter curvus 525.92]MBN7288058.1 TOBE domain-containing protein [Campylobacter curvus]MDU6828048.1 TOBE domain-containing protein [Campylobacter sp.]